MQRYIVVTPHGAPCVAASEDRLTLDALQHLVGGWIEPAPHPFADDIVCYINEEGKLLRLDRNDVVTDALAPALMPSDYIAGTAVFSAVDDAGDARGLTDDEIGRILHALGASPSPP